MESTSTFSIWLKCLNMQYQLQVFDLHNSNSSYAFVLLDFSPSTIASCRFLLSHQSEFLDFSQYILLLSYNSTKTNCHNTFPSWLHDENWNELGCGIYIMRSAGICWWERAPLLWWKRVRWWSALKIRRRLQVIMIC